MQALFDAVNAVCDKIQVVSDLFWDFPTNFDWYANIPILGNFSLAIILLIGSGIFFTCQLRFIQVRKFRYGIRVLKEQKAKTGISPWASFLLSTAMRVGPGNILGVTGAISVGGPGALFWMWVSAFFGHGHRLHRVHPVPDLQGEEGRRVHRRACPSTDAAC